MTQLQVIEMSRQSLSTHARSFRWGAFFLAEDQRDDAALLYALCRLIDDLADDAPDVHVASMQLGQLRELLLGHPLVESTLGDDVAPLVHAFLDMAKRRGLDVSCVFELIDGVESDLGVVCFQDDTELLRYCYRVAGVVGLMMCPILGVTDADAQAHAIDLGVAMQLTNICRDVLEDAHRGRVYLPAERLLAKGVTSQDVLNGSDCGVAVKSVVQDLLQMAESYYSSANVGMDYIPARSRFAILVAARLYRGIGRKILTQDHNPLAGRVWVSGPGKMVWVVIAVLAFFSRFFVRSSTSHNRQLHTPLRGLPGIQV